MPFKSSLYRKASFARWHKKQPNRRELVTVNMISLPLGDFRHLAHIGAQACHDSFGDLSFLKKGHGLFRQSSQSEQNLFLACAPPPKPPRLNLEETDPQVSPTWDGERYPSQRQKKCNSMPLLDCEEGEQPAPEAGGGSAGRGSYGSGRDSESLQTCPEEPLQTCPEEPLQTCPEEPRAEEEDPAFTLDLDLGPSILDDVLQVMDKLHQ